MVGGADGDRALSSVVTDRSRPEGGICGASEGLPPRADDKDGACTPYASRHIVPYLLEERGLARFAGPEEEELADLLVLGVLVAHHCLEGLVAPTLFVILLLLLW